MSAARQENVARWNMYKSRVDAAGSAVIRATQFLVRPTERFPACDLYSIDSLWRTWRDEEECFWRMTSPHDTAPSRSFPKMPAVDGQECCYRMWGLLIQVQIDGTHGSTRFLAETVQQIAANEKCKSHPETCSCHVPNHPWVDREDMEALAPINPKHRLDRRCGGYTLFSTPRCKQKEQAAAAVKAEFDAQKGPYITKGFPSEFCMCDTQRSCTCGKPEKENVDRAMLLDASGNLTPEMGQALCGKGWVKLREAKPKTYDYKHNVETCACGVCHKSRVDSGTEAAYYKRCQDAASAAMARLRAPSVGAAVASKPSSIGAAIANADLAIARASAACGGGPDHPDFAKQLFAAMGTPHDSQCPHGLPFYSCMPCSH